MKDWLKLATYNKSLAPDEPRKKWLERSKNFAKNKGQSTKEGDNEAKVKFVPFRGSVRKKIQEFETQVEKKDGEKKPPRSKHISGLEKLIESVDSLAKDALKSNPSPVLDSPAKQLPSQSSTSIEGVECPQGQFCLPLSDLKPVDIGPPSPGTHTDMASEIEEQPYVSRKLLVKQLLEEELKNLHTNENIDLDSQEDDKSLADSWSELEENFTRIYEPVPFDIRMNSWRKMNKYQILSKVSSKRLVEELKPLSRTEILEKIEQVRVFAPKLYPAAPIFGKKLQPKIEVVAQVHRDYHKGSLNAQEETSDDEIQDDSGGDSDSSWFKLYKSIRDLDKCLDKHMVATADETTSWESISTNGDAHEDPFSVSRSEILSRHDSIYSFRPLEGNGFHSICESQLVTPEAVIHLPFPPVSRKAILGNSTRENDLLNGLNGQNAIYRSRSEVGETNDVKNEIKFKDHKDINITGHRDPCISEPSNSPDVIRARIPAPSESNESFDSWSLDFSDVYQPFSEAEKRAIKSENLAQVFEEQRRRETQKKMALVVENNCSLLNRINSADSWSLSEGEALDSPRILSRAEILSKGMRLRESPALELQRRVGEILSMHDHIETPIKEKVMNILSEHIKKNHIVNDLDDAETKNREMKDQLMDVLAKDWETLNSVNLGFIYVPMEESTKHPSKMPCKEAPDYDTFGSLDSLIFAPKTSHSEEGTTARIEQSKKLASVGDEADKDRDHRTRSTSIHEEGPPSSHFVMNSPNTKGVSIIESVRTDKNLSTTNPVIPRGADSLAANEVEGAPPKKKMLWMRLQKGLSESLFKSSSKNESFMKCSKNASLSQNINSDPDNLTSVASSATDVSPSSLESTSIDSDTESITSVESVIYNAKFKLKEMEEDKRKLRLSRTYVVNPCTESDSSSEQEAGSQGHSSGQNLLDSDTSWDYIEPLKAAEFTKSILEEEANYASSYRPLFNKTSMDDSSYVNIPPNLKDSNLNGNELQRAVEFDTDAVPISASHAVLPPPPINPTAPPNPEQENVYEECGPTYKKMPPIPLQKYHVYQSLDATLSYTSEETSGVRSELAQLSHHSFHESNPILSHHKEMITITDESFPDTQESCESSSSDHLKDLGTTDGSPVQGEVVTCSGGMVLTDDSLEQSCEKSTDTKLSVSNASHKIKKLQKFGISLMGNENSDLMMRELKLKLRRKFNAEGDIEEVEEHCLESKPLNFLSQSVVSKPILSYEGMNSVASKRNQLAPHMSKIFTSFDVKRKALEIENRLARSEEDKDGFKGSKGLKQELNEEEKQRTRAPDLIFAEIGDSIILIPTPDYTPLSTLPRDDKEDSVQVPALPFYFAPCNNGDSIYSNLEKFVEMHTKGSERATSPSQSPESVLVTDKRRAARAQTSSPKRSVRFHTPLRSVQQPSLGATWSDMESIIFAEDRSFGSETFDQGGRPSSPLTEANEAAVMLRLPETRMESYKDDWLLWDQLAKMKRSKTPEDRERWEMEKTKRMLLWIHLSNNDVQREWCYKSHWWKAKQKASVAWIVQKAHKNKVPADFEEPYYKDYEGQERLKPGIVHRLSNADLYCSALANIYGDPNFHNRSHWNIIQALARKGVYVAEPTDVSLTETVLIQTTPIKMSAHLAVIEAMMALYIREVVIAERVVQAIQRISGIPHSQGIPTPQDQEEALVLWVEHTTQSLQSRIHHHVQPSQGQELPMFPKIQDLSDLSDGIGLAALVAFYCPHELSWADIAVADPPSMADSLYNISLVIKFCHESLPYNPCLLTKEDIVYMHSSVKQNILAFVAELFFLMELEPVSCVSIANTKKTSTKYIQLSSPGFGGRYSSCSGGNSGWSGYQHSGRIIPDLRQSLSPSSTPSAHSTHSTGSSSSFSAPSSTHSHHHRSSYASSLRGMKPAGVPSVRRSHSMNLNDVADSRSRAESRSENAPSSHNSDYGGRESSMSDGQEGEFMVQRAKGYSTLSDMMRNQSSPRPSQTESSQEFFVNSRSTTKERYNIESKEEELGERRLSRRGSFYGSSQELNELPPAGIPSRLEQRPLGRSRSRRNSINAEESQLTIENFGGSQDNLNYASRNPDKEPYIHSGKRDSHSNLGGRERRSSSQTRERNDFGSSLDELDNRVIDKLEKDALEKEKRERRLSSREVPTKERRKGRIENAALDSSSESEASFDPEKPVGKATSFAELSKLKEQLPGGINIIYMQSDRDEGGRPHHTKEKKTTFAALPNQTTWKQQSVQSQVEDNSDVTDDNMEPQIVSSELHNVKLKLEEKRRRIEAEKRKMEMMMNKQRQKLGKEAFMQAVVKGGKGTSSTGSSTPTTASEPDPTEMLADSFEQSLNRSRIAPLSSPSHSISHPPVSTSSSLPLLSSPPSVATTTPPAAPSHSTLTKTPPIASPPTRPNTILSLKDLGTEVSNVSKRWLDSGNHSEELKTPDMDAMDYDEYQKSLTQMTDSLTEIQSDIQRLSHQQQQIQSMMHNGVPAQHPANIPPGQHQNQFYLHDQQQSSPVRRMWGQSNTDSYSMSPATRRAQWGPVRPMMPQSDYMIGGPPQSAGYYYQMNQPPMQLPPLSQMGHHHPPPPPPHGQGAGFMLHGQPQSLPAGHQPNLYQNGQNFYSPEHYRGYPNQVYDSSRVPPLSQGGNTPFRLHNEGSPGGDDSRGPSSLRSSAQSSPSRQVQPQRQQKSPSPSRQVSHAPVSAPPPDDMEPQNVCFIDTEEGDKLKRLSISSGSRTYRISHEPGSPTRPQLGTKTFRVPTKKGTPIYDDSDLPQPSPPQRSLSPPYQHHYASQEDSRSIRTEPLVEGLKADKGFYISLDDNAGPKRPKPELRPKRLSQKKHSTPTTPLSTPSREDAPPIPDHSSLRSPSSGPRDNSLSFGSLKLRRDSSNRSMPHSMASPTYSSTRPAFPSHSDVSPSPSSSASSIPAKNNCWSSPNPRDNIRNNNNNDYSFEDYTQGSDTGSDGALDEVSKVVVTRKKSDIAAGMALVIGEDLVNEDSSLSEMEKKKEKLMMMSMKRKQQQEEMRRKKEMEAEMKREEGKIKEDLKQRKKEEEKARRELILERHKIKKAIEEAEKEGRHYTPPAWYQEDSGSNTPTSKTSSVRMRSKPGGTKPRPKTMHEGSFTGSEERLVSGGKKGSSQNLAAESVRKSSGRWGSSSSLSRSAGNRGSTGSLGPEYSSASASRTLGRHSGRRPTSVLGSSGSLVKRERNKGSLYGSRSTGLEDHDLYQVHESRRPSLASTRSRYRYNVPSCYDSSGTASPRKYRSTGNLYGHNEHESLLYHMSEDSGLGRATPPRRVPSPGMSSRHLPSPSGPGSLPPGLFSRRRPGTFDDNMSDISTTSSNMDYCGPRLFKQPTAKSNRNIILNAVEYCVFPGVVNQTAKQRVLEEVARSESKHFLILFRDAGCQFRALYSYNPDLEEVFKLYGTGPKQVTDRMFDRFFKYNSGGKCFSQIHTKHLTVTIDAFTIHNSLWQGKKVNLPSKKDMKLVI